MLVIALIITSQLVGSLMTMMMAIMYLPNYDTLKREVWYFEEGGVVL